MKHVNLSAKHIIDFKIVHLFCVLRSVSFEGPMEDEFTSEIPRSSYCYISLLNPHGVLLFTLSL